MKGRSHQSGKKVRTFILFLILACIIWVLTKFSNQDTATITSTLEYVDLPENTVLAESYPGSVSFDLTANGFDFLIYKIKPPTVEIEVENYFDQQKREAYVDNSELIRLISSGLNKSISVRNLTVSELRLKLDTLVSKKLPVEPSLELSFKNGFRQVGNVLLVPDSVEVKGTAEDIANTAVLRTEAIEQSALANDLSLLVSIDTSDIRIFSIDPSKVEVSVDVEEFTQKSINVEPVLANPPENSTVKLIPGLLQLTFDVPVKRFNEVTADDFEVICDFDKRNDEENFILPELVKQPVDIYNIEFSSKKIDYLIFK